jgi:predicted dehydrogenase
VLTRGCVFPQIADVAFINIRFRTGTIAHVELSWLAPSKLRRTTVVGSQKMVVYDDTSITEPVRIYDSSVLLARPETFGEYQLSYRTGEIVSPRIDIAEPLALEMRDFCNSITRGAEPRSSLQVGLDVVRVIEATERSQQRGGAETSIPQTPDLAVALCQRIANAPAAPGWRSP